MPFISNYFGIYLIFKPLDLFKYFKNIKIQIIYTIHL
jgi:hypothetical protein